MTKVPPIANVDWNAVRPDDPDPLESQDWLNSFDAVVAVQGITRAMQLLRRLECRGGGTGRRFVRRSLFGVSQLDFGRRTGGPSRDVSLEERITAIIRWNALAMVARANQSYGELGGHIASYASAAEIFEVGFHHFFRGPAAEQGGDLVFFQAHSAPGVYARAYLEGRLDEAQLNRFRREVSGGGLSSYPHPWLMPQFWQFPTGSMGIGPISAVYQARFLRYLQHRGLACTHERRVWGIFGDGEMDEPESIAGLTLAARENLDNLTFVINCNLQRLDGPFVEMARSFWNSRLFRGAGWNVVKVLWSSDCDVLFARDTNNALLRQFAATVDGQYQTLGANDGAYNKEHFFILIPSFANSLPICRSRQSARSSAVAMISESFMQPFMLR